MKFLYNRKLAVIILVICIVGTILVGGGRSLERYRDTQGQLFYNGTTGDGNSIASDLRARCEAGHNLITVAKRYMDANAAEIKALSDSITTLENAATVREAFDANYDLTLSADHLYSVLNNTALSDADKKLVSGQFTELTSRNQTISHDGYNTVAVEFNDLLGRFPTSVIAMANGIVPLELFR
ncbi:MAG: hypothetical protein VB111_12810 [Clostridiaceae bacterium]|nr:hypothetical protein [Clostridiaceae bacterium]